MKRCVQVSDTTGDPQRTNVGSQKERNLRFVNRLFYLAFSNDLIHSAILRASAFGTCGIGGIGVE